MGGLFRRVWFRVRWMFMDARSRYAYFWTRTQENW